MHLPIPPRYHIYLCAHLTHEDAAMQRKTEAKQIACEAE